MAAVEYFASLLGCVRGGSCPAVVEAGPGSVLALIVLLALLAGGVRLTCAAAGAGRRRLALPAMTSHAVRLLTVPAAVVVWFLLAFGHAGPMLGRFDSYLIWMVTVPLYTALLVLGVVAMVGYAGLVLQGATSPARLLPPTGWGRLAVGAGAIGVLLAWRHVYLTDATVRSGPFGHGPAWLDRALEVWSLRWPAEFFWWAGRLLVREEVILGVVALLVLAALLTPGVVGPGDHVLLRLVGRITATVVALVLGVVAVGALVLLAVTLSGHLAWVALAAVVLAVLLGAGARVRVVTG